MLIAFDTFRVILSLESHRSSLLVNMLTHKWLGQVHVGSAFVLGDGTVALLRVRALGCML